MVCNRVRPAAPWTVRACFCLLFVFFVCLPTQVRADGVSGRVYDPNNKPLADASLTAQSQSGGASVDFRTDKSGNFSVYLEPGRYEVVTKEDRSLKGSVESYSRPVQQDIHLKKEVNQSHVRK